MSGNVVQCIRSPSWEVYLCVYLRVGIFAQRRLLGKMDDGQ